MGWIKGKSHGKKISEYVILPPKRKETGWDMFTMCQDDPERIARLNRIKAELERDQCR